MAEFTNRSRACAHPKLNRAFQLMRKKGLVAKQRFWCCSSCAGYAITTIGEKRVKNGQEVMGCCFYHDQDYDNLKNGEDFYLAYGPMQSNDVGQIGMKDEQVGKIVCECLEACGIKYEWSGKSEDRIKVKTDSLQ